ncbi:MAG: hypothetical protein V4819_11885 [Verrucomicrobiota bacterium]
MATAPTRRVIGITRSEVEILAPATLTMKVFGLGEVPALKRLHAFVKLKETLLVADSATGQQAASVAKHFDARSIWKRFCSDWPLT